ncbi:hypothetical protein KO500_10770 [Cellulophaga baltica]|uniref:hypothetical protein n=1 Tax=Cellulophaga TaxID=104264 RepID=UPI001C075343|nr:MULTISPECIES: hypothetical protein [Cellulophaga]MBU2996922.1 hypothetical protein [Cellulophaga baltica]MDO6768320.1 hypothetical protein [Cellulophaga sp. 1_MG-2023]
MSAQKAHFQTAGLWHPDLDFTTDAVIIYGPPEDFSKNANSWKQKGYEIQSMMSSSWGHSAFFKSIGFNDLSKNPYAQKDENGNVAKHGEHEFYIVPDLIFTNYLKENISNIIDNGASAIYLEEPEYFNYTGYSKVFKQNWQLKYNTLWLNQYSSADAYYNSALLKSDFYFKHLKALAKHIKIYSNDKVKCYIPTHSILNYSLWQIISPETSFNTIDEVDGYIGQVWTGTARTPIYYNGIYKERTFENAYLEYASLRAMAYSGDKKIFFLTDPIEDDPEHTWDDYRENYHKTFVAQMLFSDVSNYEVLPWPDRIFFKSYLDRNGEKSIISKELSILINAMHDIGSSEYKTSPIGVMLSRTLMYQSNYNRESYEDKRSSNFYGLALPLVKHGINPNIVFLEEFSQSIKDTKVLLVTYENMKPLSKEYHNSILKWIKSGGVLLFFGENKNVFNTINQWWTKDGYTYPAKHLFEVLGVEESEELQTVGRGKFLFVNENPEKYVLNPKGQDSLTSRLKEVFEVIDEPWLTKNYFKETRGAYNVISVMNESETNQPYNLKGNYVDLFNASLPILNEIETKPNEVNFLYDLDHLDSDTDFKIIASSFRVLETTKSKKSYTLKIKGATSAKGIARFYCNEKPKRVLLNGEKVTMESGPNATYLINFTQVKNSNTLEIIIK